MPSRTRSTTFLASLLALTILPAAISAQTKWAFSCSTNHPKNYVELHPADVYGKDARTYGFDLSTAPASMEGHACSSTSPSSSLSPCPTATTASTSASPAHCLRRHHPRRITPPRHFDNNPSPSAATIKSTSTSTSAQRKSQRPAATDKPQQVKLKPREIGALDWDDKLTLEFNGDHPSVRSIVIEPITTSPPSTSPATPPSSTRTRNPGPPGARCSPPSSTTKSSSPTTPNPAKPSRASSANAASPKSCPPGSPATSSSSSSRTTTRSPAPARPHPRVQRPPPQIHHGSQRSQAPHPSSSPA